MTAAASAHTSSVVAPGEVLAGKYRVESVIGEGGMGIVVCAVHIQLEHRVAVKFLRPDVLRDEQATARFAREAKAAAKIRSEHVARVLDVGVLDNGAPYMVMEYLEGIDLKRAVRENGVLPAEEAARYILQACEAIAEAHAAGIIHRDLKPANLFLANRPGGENIVKVLDFGISRELGATLQGLTHSHSLMGTPYYMSPEQLISPKEVDPRTDVWSLGIILFELLSGLPPYGGASLPEVVASVLRGAPPSSRLPAGVPDSLRKVIDRCLTHSLKSRYQNVAELVADLAEASPSQGQASSIRIRHVLHLSLSGAASRDEAALVSSSDKATQDGGAPSIESSPPAKLIVSDETVDSWQAPSVSRRGGVTLGNKRRYSVAAAAAVIVGIGVWIGARVSHEHPPSSTSSVAPPLPIAKAQVAPVEVSKPEPSAATVPSASAAPVTSARLRSMPARAPAAPSVVPSIGPASSARVAPKEAVPAPANPLDIRIQ